jgi:hypothetical protein
LRFVLRHLVLMLLRCVVVVVLPSRADLVFACFGVLRFGFVGLRFGFDFRLGFVVLRFDHLAILLSERKENGERKRRRDVVLCREWVRGSPPHPRWLMQDFVPTRREHE